MDFLCRLALDFVSQKPIRELAAVFFNMSYKIRNWKKFQHFKDRRPPWIKLYRDLLDDLNWHQLSGDACKMLVNCWLIASESDGVLPDTKTLSFRLRTSEENIKRRLSTLSKWLEQDDITVISPRYQDDTPETETETETETEKDVSSALSKSDNREAAPDPILLTYPTAGKEKTWDLKTSRVSAWKGLFPGLDVLQECRAALAWVETNSRKTASGMPRFLARWLTKSQNRGGFQKTEVKKREVVI